MSELSRLFRNRQDRATVDELLASRVADVLSVREDIDTADEAGRERYRRVGDLLMLAYEGAPLAASTRRELVDRYSTEVLDAWLELVGTPQERRATPLADVRARLLGLARRWGTPEARTLMAPYLVFAQLHEPAELEIAVRQLRWSGCATPTSRPSTWASTSTTRTGGSSRRRRRTHSATSRRWPPATAQARTTPLLASSPTTRPRRPRSPSWPTCAPATTEWLAPQRDLPAVPADAVAVEVTPEGFDVQHAMDPRLSRRVVAVLANRVAERGAYGAPSLKHISRNPRKLFRVVDFLLAHGSVAVTANVFIEPGRITRRADPASYNELDLSWAGFEYDRAFSSPGHNDPCPAGRD